MGRMGQDLGVKSNLKTGMKLKARKMQNLRLRVSSGWGSYRKRIFFSIEKANSANYILL